MSNRVRFPIGNPENPMSDHEIHSKFMRNIMGKISALQAESLYETIGSLESVMDMKEVTMLLVAPELQAATAARHKGPHGALAAVKLPPFEDEEGLLRRVRRFSSK